MADWDFLDEVDVLVKLSADFKEKLESKKWQERKEALEQLQGLLANNPRLSTKANYGEIVNTMQVVLAKDANINCNALAAKCISGFATGLRGKFAPFANQIVPVCAERFKEKKPILRDPLIECIDAVASTVQLENLTEEIVAGMDKQNPQIKLQMDNFIFRQMNKFSADKAPRKLIKLVVPILAKHASEADAEVREASLAAIGSVQRMIGDKNVKSMIGDLEKDENKMKKVNEGAARAAELAAEHAAKSAPPAASSTKNGGGNEETETESAPTSARPTTKAKEADPWDFADAFDILGKMPSIFEGETGVESKKWTERKDALQALLDLLVANIKLCPKGNYAELVGVLRKILEKDANINVAALAAKCLTHIATGLRTKFGPHASTILPAILEKFKEKKATLAVPLVELIDAVVDTTTLESMESDLVAALGKPNPQMKGQTAQFLKRAFIKLNSTTMPKKTLKALAPLLVKHTGDADTEVRDAACAALGAAMAVIGEKPMMTMMGEIADDKLKMGKVKESFEALKGEVQEAAPPPAAPPKTESKAPTGKPPVKGPAKKAPPKEEKEEEEEELEEPPPKPAAKAAPKKVIAAKEEPKEEDEEEVKKKAEELLSVNEEKKMRLKDEKTLKILKWNFALPDEEHISQLMTLLGAQAKASLVGLLFHKDFKQHIKAMDELNKMADADPLPLIKNSDLILKWCTLRFFETNPAALIKALELALRVLNHCLEMDEPMAAEEVSAFLPYLLLKTGEQKENMRQTVREIIDVLSSICGPLKLCPMVIDALKTKNSRQRAECLSVLEKYVTTVGLAQLKQLGVVKVMAACVSDRDTNVRNAAINGLVACYRDEGERIWQSAGKMEAKEKQMVEERIKRSGAAPGSARPPVAGTPAQGMRTGGARIASQNGTTIRGRASSRDGNREGSHTRDSSPVTSRGHNSTFNANDRGTVSKFQLDDDIDNLPSENNMSMSQVIAHLEQVAVVPPSRYGGGTLKRTNSASSIGSSVVDSIEALDKVIQNVSSMVADICIEAIEQLSFVLGVEEQRPLLRERVNLLLPAIAAQVKLIRKFANKADEERLAERMKALLNFTSNFTLTSTELRCASAEAVEPFIYEFIWIINDSDFKLVRESEQMIRSINKLAIKSCSMSEPNAFFAAVSNCISKDLLMGKEGEGTSTLFTKCLSKFSTELRERMDLNSVAETANAFYTSLSSLPNQSTNSSEAYTAVHNVIEKAISQAKANPREVFSRVRNMDSRLRQRVDAWADTLGPAHIHPLILNVLKDMGGMSKTIPALADHIMQRPTEKDAFEKMLSQVPMGDYIYQLMSKYSAFREGRSEFRPAYPSQAVVPIMQRAVNNAIHSNKFLGGEASSQYGFASVNSMETSVSLPNISAALADPPSFVPSTVTKPKRRTMNPAELAPLKERLNQIAD